ALRGQRVEGLEKVRVRDCFRHRCLIEGERDFVDLSRLRKLHGADIGCAVVLPVEEAGGESFEGDGERLCAVPVAVSHHSFAESVLELLKDVQIELQMYIA